jgi:translation elongation factor EF-Ts
MTMLLREKLKAETVKTLNKITGAGLSVCKKALEECNYNVLEAFEKIQTWAFGVVYD